MNDISCCIIAVQKNEPYINDWIQYHINQGFSHIFIIDNNDVGNELTIPAEFKSYVSIFPANGIIDWHISPIQAKLYNSVLDYIRSINSIKKLYTHVLCIDIDEYFYYKEGGINEFISNVMRDSISCSFSWDCYGDNDIIYKKDLQYDSPIKNYTERAKHGWVSNDCKSIALITNDTKLDIHYHNGRCYRLINKWVANIKHYRTQCLEEYVDKIRLRRCGDNEYWYENNKNNVRVYFNYNNITLEKLEAFEYFYKKYDMIMSDEDKEFIEINKQILKRKK